MATKSKKQIEIEEIVKRADIRLSQELSKSWSFTKKIASLEQHPGLIFEITSLILGEDEGRLAEILEDNSEKMVEFIKPILLKKSS